MQIVFFGTPDFVLPVLRTLSANFTVAAVVTTPDTYQGRKKILTPTPVATYAKEHGITTILTPQKLDVAALESLKVLDADLYVVAAYGKIIPQAILSLPRCGALNIHPSLLPKYRGPSPIQSALLQGDTVTGVTIIQMDAKMDHGPIVAQEVVPLIGSETFAELHVSLFTKASELLRKTIPDYVSGKITSRQQTEADATYCQMITKEDGHISIDNPPPPEHLDRMIRAYYPWPTVWTTWQLAPGKTQIVKLLPGQNVQLEGGKPMSIKDLRNGYPKVAERVASILKAES